VDFGNYVPLLVGGDANKSLSFFRVDFHFR
jgi:hypothetical protein